MPEPENPYFETASFHVSTIDWACWVGYTVENRPPSGGPSLRTFAWGKMKVEQRRNSDHALTRTFLLDFSVAGAPYNMAEYPPVDTTIYVQCKAPFTPAAPAGYTNVRVGIVYDGAMIGDLVSGAAAVARYDTDYPPQMPL